MPGDSHWLQGGLNVPVPPPKAPLKLPPGVKLDYLNDNETLEAMMEKGALDALYSVYIPTIFRNGSPSIARLWPNFKEVETEYSRRTGIFPVMHLIVIREDVHRAHPELAPRIYRAFCEARDHALEALPDSDALHVALPFLLDHVEETWRIFGKHYWEYGIAPNRPAFEAMGRYLFEQGLAERVVTPEEMYLQV
jgi:4,5-dihydroxyphthalate decarboxylase